MAHKLIHFTSLMYVHYLVNLWESKSWQ